MSKDLIDINNTIYYQNRIESIINEYKELNNLDPVKLSNVQFYSFLRYIYNNVPLYRIDNKKIQNKIPLLRECLSIEVIDTYIDLYMDLSSSSNKVLSIRGFNALYGVNLSHYRLTEIDKIDISTLNGRIDKYIYNYIYTRLKSERQFALQDGALDHSVTALALGKIEFGWSEDSKNKQNTELLPEFQSPFELLNKDYSRKTVQIAQKD